MSPMSSQFMSHSSMYMGSMSSMAAAGMQQPHSAFSLGSNTSATNGITGNSMVNIQYLGIFGFIYIIKGRVQKKKRLKRVTSYKKVG